MCLFWHFYKSRNNIDSLRSSSEQFGTLTKTNISSSLVIDRTKDPGKDTNMQKVLKDLNIFLWNKKQDVTREVFCWKKSSKNLEVERLRKRPATLPRPIELPQVCPAVIMSQVVWLRESPPGLGRIPTRLRESQPGFWLRASKKMLEEFRC